MKYKQEQQPLTYDVCVSFIKIWRLINCIQAFRAYTDRFSDIFIPKKTVQLIIVHLGFMSCLHNQYDHSY
jgi:hypothetical protein